MVVVRKTLGTESTPLAVALLKGCLLLGEPVLRWTLARAGSMIISYPCLCCAILSHPARFFETHLASIATAWLVDLDTCPPFRAHEARRGGLYIITLGTLITTTHSPKPMFFCYISRVSLQFTLLWELHRKFCSASGAGGKGGTRCIRLQEVPREEPELSKSR